MGVVYKAEDTKLGRFVALKFLSDELSNDEAAMDRFLLEARAAAALSHPHISTIHEIDEHDGHTFIAMEYLEGMNLKAAIDERPMKVPAVVRIGIQVAEALAAAHAKGIIHRDIKPTNIFLTEGQQAKVLDFGLAKLGEASQDGADDETIGSSETTRISDLTRAGTAVGTVAYMSPEQALGEEVDAGTDLFSLGALLYEMLTGRQAFTGPTPAAIFDKILHQNPPSPSQLGIQIPLELEQILHKAMEKNRSLRYQSMFELHVDLRRVRRALESGSAVPVAVADASGPVEAVDPDGSTASVPVATRSGAAAVAEVSRWKLWVGAAALVAVAAALTALLVTRGPVPAGLSEADSLLLTDFVNSTDDPVFDGTLKQALAVKLEESPYLNVFPEPKVRETLRFMGRSPDERLTSELAQDVCERQAIKAIVTGEIASLGSNYVITLSALECRGGRALAREQVEAAGKEEVLAAVGGAATRIRQQLGESLASVEQFDAPVEQATTSSLKALEAFSLGEQTRSRGAEEEAIRHFQRALEHDPEFAMAYARLGTTHVNLGETTKGLEYKQRAFELRDRVSERERLYITAHYHGSVTGLVDREIETYELWKQTYPRDWAPWNNLATQHNTIGRYERAAEEAAEAARLAPGHAFPLTGLGNALLALGRAEEAKAAYREAEAGEAEWYGVYTGLYEIAFLEGDEAEMARLIEVVGGRPAEARLLQARSDAAAAHGALEDARRLNRQAIDGALRTGRDEIAALLAADGALNRALFGYLEEARLQATEALELARSREVLQRAALIFALSEAPREASDLVDELEERYPTDTLNNAVHLANARAALAIGRGNGERAIEELASAAPYERGFLISIYLRGLAYLELGDGNRASAEFGKIEALAGVDPLSPLHSVAQLGLARARALGGDAAAARRAYQRFFAALAAPDQGLLLLEVAENESQALP